MMYQKQREEGVDDSPVAVLYQRHAHTILRYVNRHIHLKEDADDLVLEVFMVALSNKAWVSWDEQEQLAWLRRIAHNKMVDHLRRISRRPSVVLDDALDLLIEDEYRSPEQTALRNEDHVQLHAHLNNLSAAPTGDSAFALCLQSANKRNCSDREYKRWCCTRNALTSAQCFAARL